jgi:DNA repair photolyase
MPVLPAITDSQPALEALVKAVAERGASYLNTCSLRLRTTARERYLPFIEQEFPHLAKRYWATYGRSDKTSAEYSAKLKARVGELCAKHGVPFGHNGRSADAEEESEVVAQRFAGQLQLEMGLE